MNKYNPEKIEKIRRPAEAEIKPFAVYALYNDEARKIYIEQKYEI